MHGGGLQLPGVSNDAVLDRQVRVRVRQVLQEIRQTW